MDFGNEDLVASLLFCPLMWNPNTGFNMSSTPVFIMSTMFWVETEVYIPVSADLAIFLDLCSRHEIFFGGAYHDGSWNVKVKCIGSL